MSLHPYEGFKLSFAIDFDHPVFREQTGRVTLDMDTETFVREISRARTFGFVHEFEYMRSRGLARGGSVDNAIVIDDFHILNEGGLRYEDEFVKHKILDAMGDLYLAGHQLLAEYDGFKSGHAMNNQLIRTLLAQQESWEWATFENESPSPLNWPLPHSLQLV